jgi:hypothetical protein
MSKPSLDESLKGLEWEQCSDCLRAFSICDEYFIYKHTFGWWHVFTRGGRFQKKVRSLEAAKLAASRHFAGLVRGCFREGVWG